MLSSNIESSREEIFMQQIQVQRVYDSLYNNDYFGVARVFLEAGNTCTSESLLEAVLKAQTNFSAPDEFGERVLCDKDKKVYSLSLKTEIEDDGARSKTLLKNNEQILILYEPPIK
jgi:riboflavin biosynthesis pyrimidine reductase